MTSVKSITIRGFRSIRCVEDLQLRPINVLIGANGSGKSNFIDVFSFLQGIRAGRLQTYVGRAGGADRILHFGSRVTEELVVRVSFEGGVDGYEIVLSPTDDDRLYPLSEFVHSCDGPHRLEPRRRFEVGISSLHEVNSRNPQALEASRRIRDHLDRWHVHHFQDTGSGSPLKRTADVHNNRYLRPDGSNLAAFLYLLREMDPTRYDLIRRTVQLVAPFFDDFQLEPMALSRDKIRLEWRHQGSDAYFDVSSLSDGTLRFIALATLLLQPESHRPPVILLDEPELGLHPHAVTLLASLVRQISVSAQVILATQSPNLLDHFDPEDVLVAERMEGSAVFRRLEPEGLGVWLEDYSLGQLWEKNELGGRPAREYLR